MKFTKSIVKELKIVDTYLRNIQMLEKQWCDEGCFMVFRGETEEFETPCIPSIYRGYALKQTKNYEINMFMAMRQNNITSAENYLLNAIDAQHDGFPSRLLDVTYNCLIALYFAVTPYYHKPEDESDTKDGVVYVFQYNEAYSPMANNTKQIYNAALSGAEEMLNSTWLSYNHILIDHCKQNQRIIAQQGAFILFTGDSPEPIPYYQMYGIRISKKAKKKIRNELNSMFGIYTGSVYPEVDQMKDELKKRSLRINSRDLDLRQASEYSLECIKKEYDYFVDCCDYYISNEEGKLGEIVRIIEKRIVAHKSSLIAYYNQMLINCSSNDGDTEEKQRECKIKEERVIEETQHIVGEYNKRLSSFIKDLPKRVSEVIDYDVKSMIGGER